MKDLLTQEAMREFDDIYTRMPYKWEKWKRNREDKGKDLVELTESLSQGYFPED